MSKQDSHFFNNFSLVLGILFAVTIALFAFARHVGAEHQGKQVKTDPRYLASVEERLKPVANVAVAGQDNSKLTIAGPATAAPAPAAAAPADGIAAYDIACAACHGAGIAGAPKMGDKAAWAPRISQGKAVLYEHAIKGFIGKTGVMPPKGARTEWPDDLIKQAVDHMIAQSN
jgi:cytochrome c5